MSFRPDVDGLRAVAIVLIVAYHVGLPGFSGGFTGVDLFFVISGFLITRNLLGEGRRNGRIAFREFWGRRARRLVPALATMSIAVLLASLVVLWPLEWQLSVAGAATSTLFVSNLYFGHQATEYFADGSVNPFLHTWSLSVEEQFYVAWPLIIAASLGVPRRVRRSPRRTLQVVLGASAAVSFALNAALTAAQSPWAFFSLPTRAWEFAAGGLLASAVLPRWSAMAGSALGWTGAALIAAAATTFGPVTPYPGTAALVPTVGVLLVLASGGARRRPGLDDLLGARPSQALGRLSYSWYLWHWPLIILAVAALGRDELSVRLGAVLLALGIGACSHRWVERPIRYHPGLRASAGRSLAVAAGFAAAVLVACVATSIAARHQLEEPFDHGLRAAAADHHGPLGCDDDPALPDTCILGDVAAERTVVLVGDSHADQWLSAVEQAADEGGFRVAVRTDANCPGPEVDLAWTGTRHAAAGCARFREQTMAIIEAARPDLVVLAHASYTGRIITAPGKLGSEAEQVRTWERALTHDLRRIRATGAAVGIILDGPRLRADPLACIGRSGSVDACTPSRSEALDGSEPIRAADRRVLDATGGGAILDVADLLCSPTRCRLEADGSYTMTDRDHLTNTFVQSHQPDLAAFLERGLASSP